MNTRKGNALGYYMKYALRHSLFITAMMILLATIYLFNDVTIANYFPIRTVSVIGLNHIEKEEIRQTLVPLVSRGFFSVNVDFIRDRLQQLPWVSDINVRRSWPDRVEVTVVEKTVAARWNKSSLLSTEGHLFNPKESTTPEGLAVMLKYFVNINRILGPLHAKISYLELTPYFTWKLKLDNGMTLKIGHNDILTRLTHFVKVYPKIVGERAPDVDYIDLRYSNGMAVKWRNAG
jgi:cell division protein FtsQ